MVGGSGVTLLFPYTDDYEEEKVIHANTCATMWEIEKDNTGMPSVIGMVRAEGKEGDGDSYAG